MDGTCDVNYLTIVVDHQTLNQQDPPFGKVDHHPGLGVPAPVICGTPPQPPEFPGAVTYHPTVSLTVHGEPVTDTHLGDPVRARAAGVQTMRWWGAGPVQVVGEGAAVADQAVSVRTP